MARKRPSEPDEGQFSLDDFINHEPADADSVPEMIDLAPQPEPVEQTPSESKPLRTFTMPSAKATSPQQPTPPPGSSHHIATRREQHARRWANSHGGHRCGIGGGQHA